MSIYLLDTNVISDIVADDPRVRAKLAAAAPDRVAVPTIVVGEVRFGILKMADGAKRRQLEAKTLSVLRALAIEPVPVEAADHYARVKMYRRSAGTSMDENDLWIAATALALGAVVVTRDKDYTGTPNLLIEDWTK
jgi:predicted nucleic acid-binding protein